MTIEFTRKGYIEVWDGDILVSRHTSEWEAMESVSRLGPGEFEIRFPKIMARAVGVIAIPGQADTNPPSQVQNLIATVISATEVDLVWDAATDEAGVSAYQIYQDGAPLISVGTTAYSVTGLAPSTQYAWTVAASDPSGNQGPASDPAIATTDPNAAPVWSGLGDQTYDNGDGVNLSLDGFCTDADADPIVYSLESGSFPLGLALAGTRNEVLQGTVTTDGTYPFVLGASDGIAAVQTLNLTFTVQTPDVTAPDPPAAPTINQGDIGTNSVILTLPVSPAPDHASYTILRSLTGLAGSFGPIASDITTSTYTDDTLNASTAYWWALYDVDQVGNISGIGASVSATTQGFGAGTDLEALTTSYFVGTGGSDAADGRTHANRWATLANCTGLPTSSKVYILTGASLTSNSYSPNWDGTAQDYAVLGGYYIDPQNNQATALNEGSQAKQNTKPILTCNQQFTADRSHWVVQLNARQYWDIQDIETKLTGGLAYYDAPHISIDGNTSNFNISRVRGRALPDHATWDQYLTDGEASGIQGQSRFESYLILSNCNQFVVQDVDYLYCRGRSVFVRQNANQGYFRRGTIMYARGDSIRFSSPTIGANTNRRIVVERMRLGGSWTGDGSQTFGSYSQGLDVNRSYNIIFRDCIIYDDQENALDLKHSENVLVERCIVHGAHGRDNGFSEGENRDSPGALLAGAPSWHAIQRFNFVYDNASGFRSVDGRISYQNTAVAQQRDFTGPLSTFNPGGNSAWGTAVHGAFQDDQQTYGYRTGIYNSWVNNIAAEAVQYINQVGDGNGGGEGRLDGNLYYQTGGVPNFYFRGQQDLTLAQFQSAMQASPTANGTYTVSGFELQSRIADPKFVSLPTKPVGDYFDSGWDITPDAAQNSEAIGNAIALATVTGNGTGAVIPVTNAKYFWAGWADNGGEPGDYLRVGTDIVQVTATDHAANTITVTPSIAYTSGDEIFLCDENGTYWNNIGAAQPGFTLFDPALLQEQDLGSPPVWTNLDQSLEVGLTYNISLDTYCTDPDGSELTYSLVGGALPSNMNFSGTRNELIVGTPDAAATNNFTLQADDPFLSSTIAVEWITTTADITPPPAPDAPVITDYAANYVLLTQPADPDPDHDNYRIERSLDDTNWGVIKYGWRAADGDYVDSNCNADTTYYYRLISVDAVPSPNQNVSDPGPSVSITTKPISEQYNYGTPTPSSFTVNDTGVTNPNCQVSVSNVFSNGGTWTWGDNGSYSWTRGPTTVPGNPTQFTYRLWDYDASTPDLTDAAVWSINVQ